MAIETTLQPRQKWWNILYAVICAGLGLWGAYDYWVSIPAREQAVKEYDTAMDRYKSLQEKGAAASDAEKKEYTDLQKRLGLGELAPGAKKVERPVPPQAYDRPVQLWLYILSCGILGTPWFLWQWLAAARRRYRLADDGTLEVDGARVPAADVADIDMSKWMSKSMATVITSDGRKFLLDDYKFRNMHLIVGSIASRLHPDDWTADGRDLKKLRAEEAEAKTAASAPKPAPGD